MKGLMFLGYQYDIDAIVSGQSLPVTSVKFHCQPVYQILKKKKVQGASHIVLSMNL
jgi:hypothetical protein